MAGSRLKAGGCQSSDDPGIGVSPGPGATAFTRTTAAATQVAALEAELGARLLTRSLTIFGRRHAEKIQSSGSSSF